RSYLGAHLRDSHLAGFVFAHSRHGRHGGALTTRRDLGCSLHAWLRRWLPRPVDDRMDTRFFRRHVRHRLGPAFGLVALLMAGALVAFIRIDPQEVAGDRKRSGWRSSALRHFPDMAVSRLVWQLLAVAPVSRRRHPITSTLANEWHGEPRGSAARQSIP